MNRNNLKYKKHCVFPDNSIKKLDCKINSILHEVAKVIMQCKICDNKSITDKELEKIIIIKDPNYNAPEERYKRNNAHLTTLTRSIDEKDLKLFINKIRKLSIYGTKISPLFKLKDIADLLGPSVKKYHYKEIIKNPLLHHKYILYVQTKINSSKHEYKVAPEAFITRSGINYLTMNKLRTPLALILSEYINVVLEMLMDDDKLLEKTRNKIFKEYEILKEENSNLKIKCSSQNYKIKNLNNKIESLEYENKNLDFNLDSEYFMLKWLKTNHTKNINLILYPNSLEFEKKIFKCKIDFEDDDYINKYKKYFKLKDDIKITNEIERRKKIKYNLHNKINEILDKDIFESPNDDSNLQTTNDFIDICNYNIFDCYNFDMEKWYYMRLESNSDSDKLETAINSNSIIIKNIMSIPNVIANKMLLLITSHLKNLGCGVKLGRDKLYFEINFLYIKRFFDNYYLKQINN
jgi:hypothetical protein